MKKILIMLELDVVELSLEDQQLSSQALGSFDDDEDDDSIFDPNSYSASELAEVIEGAFHESAVREMFAGSNIYVSFKNPVIKNSQWVD